MGNSLSTDCYATPLGIVGVPPRGLDDGVADRVDGRVDGRLDGRGPPDGNGRIELVQTANVVPPGETVTVGHHVGVPGPHRTNWLIVIRSVVVGAAGVSVPAAAGETLTRWSGSLATETVQSTVPPDARSEISEPNSPGTTIIVPPAGTTESVPGAGLDGGAGGRLAVALVVGPVLAAGPVAIVAVGAPCVVGVGGDCCPVVGLATGEPGSGGGTEWGGLRSVDVARRSLLAVSVKATAAMATAIATAAAAAARPCDEERSALTRPAPCGPARPFAACTGLGNPCLPKFPARVSTAVACAAAPGPCPVASAIVCALSPDGAPSAARNDSAAPVAMAAPGDRSSSMAGRNSNVRLAVQVPQCLMCRWTRLRS